jgi:alpha-beta hydrolase superfamily lysophospholipase
MIEFIKKLLLTIRRLARVLVPGLLGAIIVIVVLVVLELNSRPDLKVWHTTVLDQEFRADSGLTNFEEYLELEDRLFEQLDQLIYQKIAPRDQRAINRYHGGSLSDPGRWPDNWNRSFVLPADDSEVAVLLLHGMSDSPYSMRSIGTALNSRGASVIGLRVPGHGQAPSGLLNVQWEDMAAAVRLAIKELGEKSSSRSLYIVGYSNGGALAVQYALDSLVDSTLTPVDGLVLMSPEIGISKLAALAKWQERLGRLLGFEKLAWNVLLPEYDPWKYGSFALNAGKQAYRITQEIQRQLGALEAGGTLKRMPPILAFQSVVDATVTAPALVNSLLRRLPAIDSREDTSSNLMHELVLFDINRYAEIEPIMKEDPSAWITTMRQDNDFNFVFTLLSNEDHEDRE